MKPVRALFLATVFSAVLGMVGCNSASESKPNPDLKVPDVPPGGSGTKSKGMEDPGAKKK